MTRFLDMPQWLQDEIVNREEAEWERIQAANRPRPPAPVNRNVCPVCLEPCIDGLCHRCQREEESDL